MAERIQVFDKRETRSISGEHAVMRMGWGIKGKF